jgi:hypothetical protein
MEFANGVKVEEIYIVKKRLVSRASYEKARGKFPDMPVSDMSSEDTSGELLKDISRERRRDRKAAANHKPDQERAREIDAFCRTMMDRGEQADAVSWIELSQNTLGELSHAVSRRLVAKLLRLGCERIHACEIHFDDEGHGNTGHLVVELPRDADRRKAILRETDRLASTQGYSGDFDDGQRYAYVGLD